MAYICEFYVGDKALQIGNESLVRALPFGPIWTKIRVGISLNFNLFSSPRLPAIMAQPWGVNQGVCTGVNNTHSNDTVDAVFSGVFPDSNSYFPVLYTAGYLAPITNVTARSYQRVGARAISIGTNSGMGAANYRYSARINVRSSFFVDVEKTSATTVNVTNWWPTAFTDVDPNAFLRALENEASPSNMNSGSTGAVALTLRTAQDWNACFFSSVWSVPTINVYRWAVARFM